MSPGRAPAPAPIPDRPIWIDGRLCRGEEARLSLFDRGARDGEGLFETVRVYRGQPFAWDRHMERLVLSAAVLGFPVPAAPRTLRGAVDRLLEAQGLEDAVVRLTVTRGVPGGRPSRTGAWVEAEPLAARLWPGTRAGAAKVVFAKRAFENAPLGAHKTTSRLAYNLARDEARATRADEVLLVNPHGSVLEGTVSNVFAVMSGVVATPPLSLGILPGITRAIVLGLCADAGFATHERPLHRDDLLQADEVFLTGSVQEVVPIGRLEGRELPAQSLGAKLREAYGRAVARAIG